MQHIKQQFNIGTGLAFPLHYNADNEMTRMRVFSQDITAIAILRAILRQAALQQRK